jgi:8-oxo-dGTP diphosphatase
MSDVPFGLSVKALIRNDAGRYLVIRRSSDSAFWPGTWDLPGGKLDPGESFDQALLREALEETGLQIRLTRYIGGTEWPLPQIRVVFVVMEATVAGGTVNLSDEHEAYQWVSACELRTLALCEPIAAVLAREGYWDTGDPPETPGE